MKQVRHVGDGLYHITSEPGDGTRYQYFIYRDGPNKFCFMPSESTFRFPQRLNYRDIGELTEEELVDMSEEERCNLWTLKECIRTITEFKEEF